VIILAVDTGGASASAAVLGDGAAGIAVSTRPRAHAQVLPGLIEEAAERAGLPRDAITHVAAARGPGLFTGMRVGLVTAQMVALALELPVVGVSSLAAAALRVQQRQRPDAAFAVLLDARRREVFAQVFGPDAVALDEPRTLTREGLRGEGGLPVAEEAIWVEEGAGSLGFPGHPLPVTGLAAEVAAVARHRWRQGAAQEPAAPLYLRRPDTSRANPQRSVLGQR
jgi:tRNA threonylcarbamoyladenosine biosynthesis protein TsaB